uniref:Uncharacterized protein n=1 Tax=Panagrolaimus sp. ES5 TaxID=591445 RepID=A0AC34GAB7_9BILA
MDQSQHALLSRFPSTYDCNRPFSTLMVLYYDLEDSVDAPRMTDEIASLLLLLLMNLVMLLDLLLLMNLLMFLDLFLLMNLLMFLDFLFLKTN